MTPKKMLGSQKFPLAQVEEGNGDVYHPKVDLK